MTHEDFSVANGSSTTSSILRSELSCPATRLRLLHEDLDVILRLKAHRNVRKAWLSTCYRRGYIRCQRYMKHSRQIACFVASKRFDKSMYAENVKCIAPKLRDSLMYKIAASSQLFPNPCPQPLNLPSLCATALEQGGRREERGKKDQKQIRVWWARTRTEVDVSEDPFGRESIDGLGNKWRSR